MYCRLPCLFNLNYFVENFMRLVILVENGVERMGFESGINKCNFFLILHQYRSTKIR